ncbi:ribosome silencing factor [Chlorobium sp. N1]|uniref:ribosome silencing factor n=1 Tax=Chlorobium sp. N1 TaxID=2491138 RepID=UPI001040D39F|nr:ribosome silencing factor [Chlorobium sp. N1]TCD48283.1 ribosome silencing factor [Chlorobium sp. N1]
MPAKKKETAAAPKKAPAEKAAPKKAAPVKVAAKRAPAKKAAVREVDVAELLARRAAELTLEKKCEEVRILDVRALTTMTDFFVIVTADSDRKARAAADHVLEALREDGERPLNIEGMETMRWILLDYVDVVVHIFMPEDRRFYDLESLWSDAAVTTVS